MTSLSGLEGLESLGGHVTIANNPVLASVVGLERLSTLGGGLVIVGSGAAKSWRRRRW